MLINIHDTSFNPDLSFSKYYSPSKFTWSRDGQGEGSVFFFSDMVLPLAKLSLYKNCFKIGLILEPKIISPSVYSYILENYKDFQMVLGHHKEIFSLPNGKEYVPWMCHVDDFDCQLYPYKDKCISIIASNKNWTIGHRLRHSIIHQYRKHMSVFGGSNPIKHKIAGLKDFMFNLAIENCKIDDSVYLTEKIIDCFVTGTVPLGYFGTDRIKEFFNPDGIIFYNEKTIGDTIKRLSNIDEAKEEYNKRLPAIRENFEIAMKHRCGEDHIFTILQKENLI